MAPSQWSFAKLEDIVTYKKGYAFNSGDYSDFGVRVIRISDTTRNSIHDKNPVYVSEDVARELESYKLITDDIILTTVGSRPHLLDSAVGKVVRVSESANGSLLNQNLVKLDPEPKKACRQYLYAVLNNKKFNCYISSLVRGNANQVSITLDGIFDYKFLLPPISEQKKIAKILTTWDKAITTTEQLLANSQRQKKALMQQLLTGRKRIVGFSEDWKNVRLGKLLVEGKERNKTGSIERVLSVTNHSGFILPEDQFSKRVASDDVTNYKVVKNGQFGYNPSRINVGSFARLDEYDVGILSPMYVIFSVDNSLLDSDYFLAWMTSCEARQRFAASTQGSVRDSVGFDALCSLHFLLPPITEQKEMARIFVSADTGIKTLQEKIKLLRQEKQALMQQLLTGKRRVKLEG